MTDGHPELKHQMRVRCLTNDLAHIRDVNVTKRLECAIHIEGPDTDLTIGTEYVVRAIEKQSDQGLWLYLHTVTENDFPYPYPMEFFEIVDSSIPGEWQTSLSPRHKGETFRLSFREWATDDAFYERLVDGDRIAVQVYRNHLKTHQL